MNKPIQLDLVAEATAVKTPAPRAPAPDATVEKLIATAGQNIPERAEWSAENPDLLVPCQPATMLYWNPFSQVVILQECRDPYEEESFVFFSIDSVPALIPRLQQMMKDGAP
jgi:hypothetical protein